MFHEAVQKIKVAHFLWTTVYIIDPPFYIAELLNFLMSL